MTTVEAIRGGQSWALGPSSPPASWFVKVTPFLRETEGWMIRVLVVDDHSFFRQTMVEVLNVDDDLHVVGECSDGTDVAAAVAELRPDVVLMDVRMQKMSGLEAARVLQSQGAGVRVLMLSSDSAPSTLAEARSSGAAGFLVKGLNPALVAQAVRRVAAGGSVWPDEPS